MFGSKKWWWEQLNLLFRFSTSSPSECVGFQPPSCVRMEVVIIPFLSGMLFPYFHHHDRYLWLRGSSSSGNSSLCWSVLCLPHTQSSGSPVLLFDWKPLEQTSSSKTCMRDGMLPLQSGWSLMMLCSLLNVAPLELLRSWKPVQKHINVSVSWLYTECRSPNCTHFVSYLHSADGTGSTYYSSAGWLAFLVLYWETVNLHQQTN